MQGRRNEFGKADGELELVSGALRAPSDSKEKLNSRFAFNYDTRTKTKTKGKAARAGATSKVGPVTFRSKNPTTSLYGNGAGGGPYEAGRGRAKRR